MSNEKLRAGGGIRLSGMAAAFVAGMMSPAPVQAEDSDAERTDRSHDIIVTGIREDDSYAPQIATVAGKAPASLLETPQSISVLTARQIEDRNLFTIGDAMQQVTGVTVMPFDGSNPDYRARGFVLDYAYDGIPSTFSSGVPEFDLVIYERLEVQRGPTGLFRGSGSPGGTINLVRKRGLRETAIAGALSAGSWSNYRGEFDIGGPIDSAGRLRVRAVGSILDRDFFQAKSHQRKVVAHGAVDFDLTPSTTLGASVTYQDNRASTPMNGQPAFSDQRFLGFPREFQHLPNWNLFTDKPVEYAGEIEQRIGAWSLRVRGLHRDIERFWMDAFVSPGTGVDPATLTAAYNRRRSDGVNGKTALDAYATGPFTLLGRTHELTVGYSYDRRTTSFQQMNATAVPNVSIFDSDVIEPPLGPFTTGSETDTRQSGFHAQARLRLLEPLTVVLGGRISDYTNKSRSIPPSAPTDFRVTSRERGRFTPSIGAVLFLTDNLTAYGSYSDIFIPQTALQRDGTTIDPRVGEQYEGGLKVRLLNGTLNASAAVFRSRDKNRALADSAAPGFFLPAGIVKIEGFEVDVTGSPLPGLDLTAGYTNLKTEYDVAAANQVGAVFDIFSPRHLYKAYARYEPAALGGLFGAIGLNGQSGVVGAGVAGIREQGPFAIANAQLGYRFNEALRAFLSVNNLFDRVYYVRVGSINTYNNYGDPRNVLFTIRARY